MTTLWGRRAVGALLVLVAGGLVGVLATPDGERVDGLWPVGLGAAALLLARGRVVALVLVTIAGVAFLTGSMVDRPEGVSLGYATTIAIECWVVARLLKAGPHRRPRLRTDADLGRLVVACVIGALLGGGGAVVTSLATGYAVPVQVGLTMGWAHLASLLILLPFVMELPDQGSQGQEPPSASRSGRPCWS